MSEVNYVYLKDICNVNQGLQIPISERLREPGPNRYFYITIQFLKGDVDHIYYIENPPKSTICNQEDIIVVRTGSTGRVLTGLVGCFHNNFFKINFDKNKVIGKYLFYCLTSPEKQFEMKKRAGITVIPDLNHSIFLDIKIPLCNLDTQQRIASVLSSLDDKIELNNRINAELEAMAKTLYDYWFVQFDFPDANGKPYKSSGGKMVYSHELKREIPEGWEVNELGGIINIQRGISYKSSEIDGGGIPMINLNSFNLKGTYKPNGIKIYSGRYNAKNVAKSGDLLIAATDVTRNADIIGKSIIVPNIYDNSDVVFSMDIAKIESSKLPNSFLMNLFNSSHYHNYIKWFASGTLVLHLNMDGLNWYKAEIPPSSILKEFDLVFQSIYERMTEIIKQNRQLASLRDWLLPMLMNGQVGFKEEINQEVQVINQSQQQDQRFEVWLSNQGLAARGEVDKVTLREIFNIMDEEEYGK